MFRKLLALVPLIAFSQMPDRPPKADEWGYRPADGGSRAMSYDQIVQAMYPMATSFVSQVDKEMTVFSGTTHVDNLQKYYQIISGMLLDPGFREDDFTRLRADAINFLKENLRGNNDEELGKEAQRVLAPGFAKP